MQAAIRETWEEAAAQVELESLYTIINLPHIDQVHMFFLATIVDGKFGVGEESLEVDLFREDQIPWKELAFPTVRETLQHYFSDIHRGMLVQHRFPVRVKDMIFNRPFKPDSSS